MASVEKSSTPTTTISQLPRFAPAVAADLLGLTLLLLLFRPLVNLFAERTIRGGMIFLVVYIAFALAVNVLKRLAPQPGRAAAFTRFFDYTPYGWIAAVLALLTIAGFLIVQIDLNQATESMIALMSRPESYGHEGEITLYYSFGPLFLWLMIGVLYLAAMVLPTQRVILPHTTRYAVIEWLSLSLINLMLILTTAYLAAALPRLPYFATHPLAAVVAAFVILELVFDPARLRHAIKQPLWLPLATFCLLIFSAAGLITAALV